MGNETQTPDGGQAVNLDKLSTALEENMTVGQELDAKIVRARKHLEELCTVKAKAEAANLLDFPGSFIRQVAWC